jgi:hypothetical protein
MLTENWKMQSSDTYITKSADETFELGRKFGSEAEAGSVFALDGDLGAGGELLEALGFRIGTLAQGSLGLDSHLALQGAAFALFPLGLGRGFVFRFVRRLRRITGGRFFCYIGRCNKRTVPL